MKILHVNKFFDLHGGAEVYLHDVMCEQSAAGHEVHAFSTHAATNLPSDDASRFVWRASLTKREGMSQDVKKAANFIWNREAKYSMRRALAEIKPDVVHLHNIYHHLSTSILEPIRRSGIPCVQTLHDLKLACPNYRMYTEGALCERCKGGRYYQAVLHHCVATTFVPNMLAAFEMGMTKVTQAYERTVRTFICPSDFMANKMIEWGEPRSKFRVVRMPITLEDPATRDGGYFLAVGRLAPDKGYEDLIRVLAKVPGATLKIAGAGPLEGKLRDLAKMHRVPLELVGFKPRAELDALYRHAIAFIASPVGYENAPLSVLRALGHGLPVIATKIGGLTEMVEDGVSGYLVPHGDDAAWIETVRRFVALSETGRMKMAEASHALAHRRFPTWSKHLAQLEEIYAMA